MDHVKQRMSQFCFTLTTTALLLNLSIAEAAPFSTDLLINGSSDFNESWSLGANGGAGSFGVISAGTSTESTFATDSSVTGSNPVSGALTDINDGVSFSSITSMTDGDYIASSLSSSISLINSSSSSLFEVSLRLDYSHTVNADSDTIASALSGHGNAYLYSIMELEKNSTSGLFYSEIWSDTLDEDYDSHSGGLTGTYGDEISASGSEIINVLLNPLDMFELDLYWSMEGWDDLNTGLVESNITTFLSIESVTERAVPAPATFWLIGLGLGLIGLAKRKKS